MSEFWTHCTKNVAKAYCVSTSFIFFTFSRYIASVFPMLNKDALEPTADLNWELSSEIGAGGT